MENNNNNPQQTPVLEVWVKHQLEKRASEDALFAKTYAKPNKSIKGCIKYIFSEARKHAESNCAAIWHDDVLNWAIHYYDEDSIDMEDKPVKASSKTSTTKTTTKVEKTPKKAKETPKKEVRPNLLLSQLKKKTEKTEKKINEKQTSGEEWLLFN